MRRCLLICEGPFDELIFSILKELFDESLLEVKPLCRCSLDTTNLVNHVDDLVNEILSKEHGYNRTDFDEICFLVDSDGIFVPNALIFEDTSLPYTNYKEDSIICPVKDSLILRNKKRMENVSNLIKDKKYWVFYNSRNLEHSFDSELVKHQSDKYKKRFALMTFNQYENDKELFIKKLFEMNKSNSLNYYDSWKYLIRDLNSLSSCSNMFVFLVMHFYALKNQYKQLIIRLIKSF